MDTRRQYKHHRFLCLYYQVKVFHFNIWKQSMKIIHMEYLQAWSKQAYPFLIPIKQQQTIFKSRYIKI